MLNKQLNTTHYITQHQHKHNIYTLHNTQHNITEHTTHTNNIHTTNTLYTKQSILFLHLKNGYLIIHLFCTVILVDLCVKDIRVSASN